MDRFSQARLLWTPINPASTNVEVLRRTINRRHPQLRLQNYRDLHRYSVNDFEFWNDLWHQLGIVYSVPPQRIVDQQYKESPQWFPGSRLNYAENILRRSDDAVACTATGELGLATHITFRDLRERVRQMAAAMLSFDLVPGDRVAVISVNSITAIVLMLATASIGGIYSSTAPDMGAVGILDRYNQIKPKLLFTETEIFYAGKTINLVPKISVVASELVAKGLKLAVLLPSTVTGSKIVIPTNLSQTIHLSTFLARDDGRELAFEQLPFGHELLILYSSGTTGAPKCIVHSAGVVFKSGILMQTMKDIAFSYGVSADDTLLQYTTTGWMMWNLMIAGLAWGARTILYDGSPLHPSLPAFLRLINDQGVSVLGVSPRLLSEMHAKRIQPLKLAPFEALRSVASGGAVLTPPLHTWAHEAFGGKVRVFTACGATDVCTAFAMSTLSEPVFAGELPCKALGMKVEVFDPSGVNIESKGEAGELVVARPHPSIPLYLWGDTSGHKFRSNYFDTYPGIWRQGDHIAVNPSTKGMMILGRSDGVLNRSGIRFGSGEIYSILEVFSSEIEDTLCVGQRRPTDEDERILLFVKMRPGKTLSNALKHNIRSIIREGLTSRHLPDEIFEVKDIPYTGNGKKIEIAVKRIVSGMKLPPSGAVANPEALLLYYQYANLVSPTKTKL